MIHGQAGVPTKGWIVEEVIDRGKHSQELCECCNKRWVRFAHRITHPNHPEVFEVGCVCAEALVESYNGKVAQTLVANRSKRREKLLAKMDPDFPKIKNDTVSVSERNGIFRVTVSRYDWRNGVIRTLFEGGPYLSRDRALIAAVEWAEP